ncbi:hypothetical protein PGTUg99_031550 [Puccinia graminis f. sp. tritici]|uniref:Uncharacterized protein n=1 Tax=Puccinia graminis f. sp. tritici TaxID=56615 RepID=A0A5B0LWU4_PUCGR|nr:hypothetical protein PGTUg99_031550 [Puccinia graminis f. sp. tritici]
MEVEPYTVQILSTVDLDLLAKALARLILVLKQRIRKFDRTVTWDRKKVSSQFESEVHRIKTILLPSIPRKLHRLCDLLFDSVYLQKLEAPQLQDGIKVLKELENIVHKISSSIDSFVVDEYQFFSNRDAERWKQYRSERAQSKLADSFFNLRCLLLLYSDLLPQLGGMTITRHEAKQKLRELIDYIHFEEEREDDRIAWFDMSELSAVQEHCGEIAEEQGKLLQELVEFPTLHKDIHVQPLREFIPILKLSRLFFNKISKPTSDESHPITSMNTDQRLNLINLVASIPTKLTKFYDEMECNYEPTQNIDLSKVSDLGKLFQAPLNLLTNCLSDQGTNPNSPQDSISKLILWYANWQCHFFVAVRRFYIAYTDAYSNFLIVN